jgi:hypothetical protein
MNNSQIGVLMYVYGCLHLTFNQLILFLKAADKQLLVTAVFSLLLLINFPTCEQAHAQGNFPRFVTIPTNWQSAKAVTILPLTNSKFQLTKGSGILVNTAAAKTGEHLITQETHSDADISLEFMMSPGGNSGIYLMGRYEVQLFDSWGVVTPRYYDCGGVFSSPGKEKRPDLTEGTAPLMNAAKAPGLWQQLRIEFQAPRFDANGKKTSNARIISVILNGTQIQKNVDILDVSPFAPYLTEAAEGPLVIQGDMGAVAIRNLQIQKFTSQYPVLSALQYRVFEGDFSNKSNTVGLAPKFAGMVELFDINVADISDDVAYEFEGSINAEEAGTYRFGIKSTARIAFYVNGKLLTDTNKFYYYGNALNVDAPLQAGSNTIKLGLYKSNKRVQPALGLTCAKSDLRPIKLNDPGSEAGLSNYTPVMIRTKGAPTLQRTFIEHEGRRRPYCMVVNQFPGINYALNLETMGMIKLWLGDMGDAGEMWSNRGDKQTIMPYMRWEELADFPLLFKSEFEAGADTAIQGKAPEFKAYQINGLGLPEFEYAFAGGKIIDRIMASDGVKSLNRKLNVTDIQAPAIWCLGKGKEILALPDGFYAIDGQRYWIRFQTKDKRLTPKLKQQGNIQWLYVELPLGSCAFEYLIVR